MAQTDYYQILGVLPSASAEEIKLAHRELVKKYHPDLYSRDADKSRATARLQQINEAYAVLGNEARRREYDKPRLRKQTTLRRAATKKRAPSKAGVTSTRRGPRRVRRKIPARLKYAVSAKWAVCLLGAVVFAWLAYAANKEPQVATAWVLLESTAVEPSQSVSERTASAANWTSIGRYSSRLHCSDGLREKVKKDEQEGSKAILDEQGGTVAITVYIRDTTKRVRNYECRETKVLKPDSLVRRLLKRVGLVS